MLKAIVVPLLLVLCFGGGFIALHKPFNPRAVFIFFGLTILLAIFGFASGMSKWISLFALILAGVALTLGRVKK